MIKSKSKLKSLCDKFFWYLPMNIYTPDYNDMDCLYHGIPLNGIFKLKKCPEFYSEEENAYEH